MLYKKHTIKNKERRTRSLIMIQILKVLKWKILKSCTHTPRNRKQCGVVRVTRLVHLPGGGPPKKELIRNIRNFSPIFSLKIRVLKRWCLAFSGGPGGFRELRGAGRNHFHLSWYVLVPGVTSYDQ